MLLPLMGFVVGCVVFSVLGWIVCALVPGFRLNIANLTLFVIGAFLGTMMSIIAYGWVFGDSNGELRSTATVLGIFAVMFIGAVLGGSGAVWLITRLRNHQRTIPMR